MRELLCRMREGIQRYEGTELGGWMALILCRSFHSLLLFFCKATDIFFLGQYVTAETHTYVRSLFPVSILSNHRLLRA